MRGETRSGPNRLSAAIGGKIIRVIPWNIWSVTYQPSSSLLEDGPSSYEFSILFLIAVPPNSPRVISEDGHIDTTGAIAGVYQEDEPMRLKCEVVGGMY